MTGTIVNAVCNSGAGGATSIVAPDPTTGAYFCNAAHTGADNTHLVGYVAADPNARFVQAQAGAVSTIGRNTVDSPHFNVWNMSVLKDNNLTERFHLQIRVDAYDVFNHPNFTLGNLSVFQVTTNALNQGYANLNAGSAFLNQNLFSGGSRLVQLGLKLTY